MLAGAVRSLRQPLRVAAGRRVGGVHRQRRRLAHRARLAARRRRRRGGRRCARESADAGGAAARRRAASCGGAIVRARGGRGVAASTSHGARTRCARSTATCWRSPAAGTRRVHLRAISAASPCWHEALSAFVPAELPPAWPSPAPRAGATTSPRPRRRRARRRAAAGTPASAAAAATAAPRRRSDGPRRRSGACAARAARPSSISRTTSPPTDIALAAREGYRSVEHLKRYTTLGMATDQGKTANVNAIALLAELTGAADRPRPAPRPSARRTRRSPSARSPARIAAGISAPRGCRRRTTGRRSTARFSSRPGRGCAPQWYPAARRDGLAGQRRPRGHGGAPRGRHLRRLHARQDRRAGPRRRRSFSIASTSTLLDTCRSARRATA